MSEKTKYWLSTILFICVIIGLTAFIVFFSSSKNNSSSDDGIGKGNEQRESILNGGEPDLSGNATFSGENTGINLENNIFYVNHDTCEFSGLGDFQYIDVYSGEVRNPESPNSAYTKKLKITPGFQEAYLCVVTNVIESVRLPGTTYYLWVIFGNEEYGGVVNVGKVPGGNYYDYNSSKSHPELNGRMYGKELQTKDKSYWLDLKQGFKVADNKTYTRPIKPIQKLNGGDIYINIGGHLSNGTDGIIKKFRIFYKGGHIEHSE